MGDDIKKRISAFIILVLISACTGTSDPTVEATVQQDPTAAGETSSPTIETILEQTVIDLTRLPIGDGRLSSQPQIGYVWSCQTTFGGPGAFQDGEWIHEDGTFDLTAKAVVDGEVNWPSEFEITVEGDRRVISGNDLPDHPTGVYPVAADDDAYDYDPNPNSIQEQQVRIELPLWPELATQSSCLTLGTIGVMISGSYFFNALDARGEDAVAHEIQYLCQGHPQATGAYHYHSYSTCFEVESIGTHSPLIGYALDGFGIYGLYGENGQLLTNADLDECHGHTHEIEWEGQLVEMYHYHATWEYPYTLGCYRGIPAGETAVQNGDNAESGDMAAAADVLGITAQQLMEALGPPPPDLEAAAAQLGITVEALRSALEQAGFPLPPG